MDGMTASRDLDALVTAISDQQEAELYERFSLIAKTFENRFYVDPDPDGMTFWLRDMGGIWPDEAFGGKAAADEARHTLILHQLISAQNRVDGNNSTDH